MWSVCSWKYLGSDTVQSTHFRTPIATTGNLQADKVQDSFDQEWGNEAAIHQGAIKGREARTDQVWGHTILPSLCPAGAAHGGSDLMRPAPLKGFDSQLLQTTLLITKETIINAEHGAWRPGLTVTFISDPFSVPRK